MLRSKQSALRQYASNGRKQVEGWFARVDAEIIRTILEYQTGNKLSGSAVEIGVHHGRCFIEMCLGLNSDERAYCVDVFESQDLNVDYSGRGDRQALESNLRKFGIDLRRVVIDSRSSIDVRTADILDAVGPARIFSVDGGHQLEIVKSDLALAETCLAPHGVIALDDFHRPDWPNVSAGYFEWYSARERAIVPFAIGLNKLYLCEANWAERYGCLVANDPFLSAFFTKMTSFSGATVRVYHQYFSPEWSLAERAIGIMKLYHPDLFVSARNSRIRRAASLFRSSIRLWGR